MIEQETIAHDFNLCVAYCDVMIDCEIVGLRFFYPQSQRIFFYIPAHLLELPAALQNPVVITLLPESAIVSLVAVFLEVTDDFA